MEQLRSIIGGLRSEDGQHPSVLDDAKVLALVKAQEVAARGLAAKPAECLDVLQSASLLDEQVPMAAGVLGPDGHATIFTASSDNTGSLWSGMLQIDEAIAHCSPTTLTYHGKSDRYELTKVIAELHGSRSDATVETLKSSDGSVLYLLRMVAMTGNLFISVVKPIPAAQPTPAVVAELTGYVNTAIDSAGRVASRLPGPADA